MEIKETPGVLCRNIGQTPVRATLCYAAEFFRSDKTKPDWTKLHKKMAYGSEWPVKKEYEQK